MNHHDRRSTTRILLTAALLLLSAAGVGCCCLKRVTLKPKLSAIDFETAKIGSADFETTFEFKECCPTKAQKATALELQREVRSLWTDLRNGVITLERYNELVEAAHLAITDVVLVCAGKPSILSSAEGLSQEQSLELAWQTAEQVLQRIQSARGTDQRRNR